MCVFVCTHVGICGSCSMNIGGENTLACIRYVHVCGGCGSLYRIAHYG